MHASKSSYEQWSDLLTFTVDTTDKSIAIFGISLNISHSCSRQLQ